jgi:hypothetical protein
VALIRFSLSIIAIFICCHRDLYKTHPSQFFDDINNLEVEHSEGLDVVQCHDMCLLHKTLGVGGGMKVSILACYCCNCLIFILNLD